jgi:hypothetical protein
MLLGKAEYVGWHVYSPALPALLCHQTVDTAAAEHLHVTRGGASSRALPHPVLGLSPISSTSIPPLAMSEWWNHAWFRGFPFSFADWMYLLCGETWFAIIVTSCPLPSRIVVFAKMGLPIS